MCIATNIQTGHQAQTSATLQVIPHQTAPIHYDNSSKLYEIERQTIEQCNRIKRDLIELNKPEEKPMFITQLKDQLNKPEGSSALFEAHLEPQSDPSMVVKWFKDGVELENASRISTFFNFGYVSLKIHHLILRDAGMSMLDNEKLFPVQMHFFMLTVYLRILQEPTRVLRRTARAIRLRPAPV